MKEVAQSIEYLRGKRQLLHQRCEFAAIHVSQDQLLHFLKCLYSKERLRHPNLLRLEHQEVSKIYLHTSYQSEKYTFQHLIRFNQHLLYPTNDPTLLFDLRKRWLMYQLLQVLVFLHQHRLPQLELTPAKLYLTSTLWLRVGSLDVVALVPPARPSRALEVSLTELWCAGEVSNFDYLMAINTAAGRTMIRGDFHPVFPWICDFTACFGGWRDLTKSKFRLNKGDDQLQTTYQQSTNPHHITESLSELTYFIYMARRTSLDILKQVVRPDFQPEEYPSSLLRLYEWTPDECIPEFFTDANVFTSIHEGLSDLEMPEWCENACEFIAMHRDMLESDQVSRDLHHWIDMNFGSALTGQEAKDRMNVPLVLPHEVNGKLAKHPGFVQLFKAPHPCKRTRPEVCLAAKKFMNTDDTDVFDKAVSDGLRLISNDNSYSRTSSSLSPKAGPEQPEKRSMELVQSPGIPEKEPHPVRDWWHLVRNNRDPENINQRTELDTLLLQAAPPMKRILPPEGKFVASSTSSAFSCASPSDTILNSAYSCLEHQTTLLLKYKDHVNLPPVKWQQSIEVFALGCIVAELYLGNPLFSCSTLASFFQLYQDHLASTSQTKTLLQKQMEFSVVHALPLLQQLPVNIKDIVVECLHPNPRLRSTVDQILEPRTTFLGNTSSREIFPWYFSQLHKFLGEFNNLRGWKEKFECTEVFFYSSGKVWQDACYLALPSLLELFQIDGADECCVTVAIISFFDPLSEKLDIDVIQQQVYPRIVSLYENAQDPRVRTALLSISLLRSIVHHVGAVIFVDTLFFQMVEWLRTRADDMEITRKACVSALGNLVRFGVLSAALVARSVIPHLLSALYRVRGSTKPVKNSQYGVADAIPMIAAAIEETTTCRMILPKTFAEVAKLVHTLVDEKVTQQVFKTTLQTIDELVGILRRLIDCISNNQILHLYLEREGTSEPHILHQLLLPSLCERVTGIATAVHSSFIRLIWTICHRVGVEMTSKYLSAILDNSLKMLIDYYDSSPGLDVTEKQAIQELGVRFVIPFELLWGRTKLHEFMPCTTALSFHQYLPFKGSMFKEVIKRVKRDVEIDSSIQQFVYSCDDIDEIYEAIASIGKQTLGRELPSRQKAKKVFVQEQPERINRNAVWSGCPLLCDIRVRENLQSSWQMKMEIQDSFRAHTTAVESLAVNLDETLAVSGSNSGSARLWSLRSEPQSLQTLRCGKYPVFSVNFLDYGERVSCCDRSFVHIWDINTSQSILRYGAPSRGFTASETTQGSNRIGVNMFRTWQTRAQIQMVAATSKSIYCFDARDNLQVVAKWKVGVPDSKEPFNSFSINSLTPFPASTVLGVGSATGAVAIIDQRVGRILSRWQAHASSIVSLFAYSDSHLLTVSAEKSCTLWDISRYSPPQAILEIEKIPELSRHSAISFHQFPEHNTLLCTSGFKVYSCNLPRPEILAPRSDRESAIIVQAEAVTPLLSDDIDQKRSPFRCFSLLPLRKLILSGSDDGKIRAWN